MKISIYWMLVLFCLGFITRCLMTVSSKRFIKRTLGKLAHF